VLQDVFGYARAAARGLTRLPIRNRACDALRHRGVDSVCDVEKRNALPISFCDQMPPYSAEEA
jgi:hypothetical protein